MGKLSAEECRLSLWRKQKLMSNIAPEGNALSGRNFIRKLVASNGRYCTTSCMFKTRLLRRSWTKNESIHKSVEQSCSRKIIVQSIFYRIHFLVCLYWKRKNFFSEEIDSESMKYFRALHAELLERNLPWAFRIWSWFVSEAHTPEIPKNAADQICTALNQVFSSLPEGTPKFRRFQKKFFSFFSRNWISLQGESSLCVRTESTNLRHWFFRRRLLQTRLILCFHLWSGILSLCHHRHSIHRCSQLFVSILHQPLKKIFPHRQKYPRILIIPDSHCRQAIVEQVHHFLAHNTRRSNASIGIGFHADCIAKYTKQIAGS